jgi:hypothetical protein
MIQPTNRPPRLIANIDVAIQFRHADADDRGLVAGLLEARRRHSWPYCKPSILQPVKASVQSAVGQRYCQTVFEDNE